MATPLEVADLVRLYGERLRQQHRLSPRQKAVLTALVRCRTATLGGHRYRCLECGEETILYNSCRDRHCPKCQGPERARWLAARREELLPVPYFHVVFTLPGSLRPWAQRHPKAIYGLLFRSAAAALLDLAADPRHLGARVGMLAVLHTWTQRLALHPHLHAIVPGGGLSADRQQWVAARNGFLLPVRVLSRRFRTFFLDGFETAWGRGDLGHAGRDELEELQRRLRNKEWVVYSQPPFGGPDRVLKYLARYTHRVAISNSRLRRLEGDTVVFTVKDRTTGKECEDRLEAVEFLRRFVQHILPKGFVRIRSYGLLAHRCRSKDLARCRAVLGAPEPELGDSAAQAPEGAPGEPLRCRYCGEGRLAFVAPLTRVAEPPLPRAPP
jgi:hypothetical protein